MYPHYGFQPRKSESRKGNTQIRTYRWQQFRWIDGTKVPRSAGSHGDLGTTALSTLHAACCMPSAACRTRAVGDRNDGVQRCLRHAAPHTLKTGWAARTACRVHHVSTPMRADLFHKLNPARGKALARPPYRAQPAGKQAGSRR